jgi:hypothetical protein
MASLAETQEERERERWWSDEQKLTAEEPRPIGIVEELAMSFFSPRPP